MDENEHAVDASTSDGSDPIQSLESQITELAAHMHAATYRLLVLVAEFDRREGWRQWGMLSCAHWLNWRCGIGLGAAREKVRVARSLERLPRIAEAFRNGEMSYSKVRALARVATSDNEEGLLALARGHTAAHLERLVSRYRRVEGASDMARARALDDSRCVRYRYDDDGALVLSARLAPEVGALVVKALDEASEILYRRERGASRFGSCEQDDSAESRRPVPSETGVSAETRSGAYTARQADALALLAESFLANGAGTRAGGDRQQVVVHVDARCLANDDEEGRAELEHGPALAREVMRRIACDAGIVTIAEAQDGTPLSVGRRTRSIPTAVERALASRDEGCRFPGCTRRYFVEGHHIRHWAHGGETSLDNLVRLCYRHHHAVHEGGFGVEHLGGNRFRFTRPDGRIIEPCPTLDSAESSAHPDIEALNRAAGVRVDAAGSLSLWG